jgi:hypothetical protein
MSFGVFAYVKVEEISQTTCKLGFANVCFAIISKAIQELLDIVMKLVC